MNSTTQRRNRIKYHTFTQNWGNTEECQVFAKRIDAWLKQFQNDEKPLMLNLLKHFKYYSERSLKQKVVELFGKFKESFEDEFILAPLQKEYGVGYSDFFFSVFWMNNNLKDCSEKNIFAIADNDRIIEIPALVFVDDYSGSGKSFMNFHKKLLKKNERLKNKKIFFLTIASSSIAIETISEYATENGYDIIFITLEKQVRAFLDNYLYKKIESEIKRRQYEEICKKHSILDMNIFGFDQIEALISFEYNTPNNTLGILWHDLDDFCCLFKRHRKQQTTLRIMQEENKQRDTIKQLKTGIHNIDEPRVNIFLLYIVVAGKRFSVMQACKELGLCLNQIEELLTKAISDGYITMGSGFPEATGKLKKYMFSSRLAQYKKILISQDLVEEKTPEIHKGSNYIPSNFTIKKGR